MKKKTISIIGTGVIGAGWAARFLVSGHNVKAYDPNKRALKKLQKEVKNSGLTIIPLKLFINDNGYAKILISLAKGKKIYDKRQVLKDRENKRQLDRIKKNNK